MRSEVGQHQDDTHVYIVLCLRGSVGKNCLQHWAERVVRLSATAFYKPADVRVSLSAILVNGWLEGESALTAALCPVPLTSRQLLLALRLPGFTDSPPQGSSPASCRDRPPTQLQRTLARMDS